MRRAGRHVAGAALALTALVTGACADPEPAPETPTAAATSASPTTSAPISSTAAPRATTAPAASPTTTSPPTADSPVTLAFGGDVHFEGAVARLLAGGDGLGALRTVLGPADVAVVNLETAITDRGTEQPKIYHFRTSPAALTTLQRAGVDAVSMANNHAVDYGADGLADTLAAQAASPIPVVGIGRDAAQAFAPAVFTVRGTTVAVIASTQVDDFTVHAFPATDTRPGVAGNLDDSRLLAAVRAAREAYDVVVVYLHWGSDYVGCPDGAQVATATRPLAGRGGRRRRGPLAPGAGRRLARTRLRRLRARELRVAQHAWPRRRGERGADRRGRPGRGPCRAGPERRAAGSRAFGRHLGNVDATAHRCRRRTRRARPCRGGRTERRVEPGPHLRPAGVPPVSPTACHSNGIHRRR